MAEIGYIIGQGIWYSGTINVIKKKEDAPLQAIFESFTNSKESITILKEKYSIAGNGEINIYLHLKKDLFSKETNKYNFDKLIIEDSGIGFDDTQFERLVNLRDNRKGFSNRGTGRIQFIHSFDRTIISSIYRDNSSSTGYKKRVITLSKSEPFLKANTILRLDSEEETISDKTWTTLTFETILEKKEEGFFSVLTANDIKEQLIKHYLVGFCESRDNLPKITIKSFIDNNEESSLGITSDDIPTPDKEKPIEISYSKVENNTIQKTSNKETFNLKAFLIPESELDKNSLNLVSKGEVAKGLKLDNLLPADQINGKRYLFFLSGKYIDERDSYNTRGEINIPSKKDFKKQNSDSFLSEEAVLWDDIEEKTNQIILSLYKEIEEKSKEKEKSILELQEMFLLNPKTIKSLQNKINFGDTDETILRKVYELDAKVAAEKDAEIKQQIKDLEQLDPTEDNYQDLLKEKVNEFVKSIPLQNRTALTQYVARRRMVLELFKKIYDKEIEKLKDGGRVDENLMHNLIFQQSSDKPENSDLWLINEEFIYFKGASECSLGNLQIDGVNIFKENLSKEEETYRLKQCGDAKLKRTDIFLFPKEEKCIIIELKAPDTNISDHLNQINRYASLINNLSKDSFKFSTYYGYLIGENIDIDDVRDNDSDFKSAFNFDYIFRPNKPIVGKFERNDGSLYTEIIKYSTLLERAKLRNKIFIDKLESGDKS